MMPRAFARDVPRGRRRFPGEPARVKLRARRISRGGERNSSCTGGAMLAITRVERTSNSVRVGRMAMATVASAPCEDFALLNRIYAEYCEMPGLCLTVA